jgi:sterol 3beta-glucosyltransferase
MIALLTYGSRGDVQPFIALGVRLLAEGYPVRLAAPARFESLVESYGLEFAPLTGDTAELARRLADQGGGNLLRVSRIIQEYAMPIAVTVFQELEMACAGADAIVYNFLFGIPAHHIARQQNVPDFLVQLQPIMMPTREFPTSGITSPPVLRGLVNRVSHWLFTQFFWQANRFSYYYVRRQGHPELPAQIQWPLAEGYNHIPPVLYAISPHIYPRPADWPPHAHMTGYWFLDEPTDWHPPADLQDFLADGPPPVYIGFGSMRSNTMKHTRDTVLSALRRTGQRGLLLTGWSGLNDDDFPADIFRLEAAPHSWLFPRMGAIMHHGGAGTTAAAFRSGVPQVVMPFFGDQFDWGRKVAELGTGPKPVPNHALDAEYLAQAIHTAATYPPMRQKAAELGRRIQAEDGAGIAAGLIIKAVS